MKIFDISQELLSSNIYPGDPKPEKFSIYSMNKGDLYNLSSLTMCVHNGTHIDAPSHFIKDGKTIDQLCLSSLVGYAYVSIFNGELSIDDAKRIINTAREANIEAAKRILIKGDAVVSKEAAEVFVKEKLLLIGNESQTVGPISSPMEVHNILLGNDIIILEGIRLDEVDEGVYFLNAAPINIKGLEGSPCRAILIKEDERK